MPSAARLPAQPSATSAPSCQPVKATNCVHGAPDCQKEAQGSCTLTPFDFALFFLAWSLSSSPLSMLSSPDHPGTRLKLCFCKRVFFVPRTACSEMCCASAEGGACRCKPSVLARVAIFCRTAAFSAALSPPVPRLAAGAASATTLFCTAFAPARCTWIQRKVNEILVSCVPIETCCVPEWRSGARHAGSGSFGGCRPVPGRAPHGRSPSNQRNHQRQPVALQPWHSPGLTQAPSSRASPARVGSLSSGRIPAARIGFWYCPLYRKS
jgi:hypothetical protein